MAEKLNNDFATVENFLVGNSLVVNLNKSKTEFVVFESHQKIARSSTVDIAMNGKKTIESENYKHLGVTLGSNMNLQGHIDNVHKNCIQHQIARKHMYIHYSAVAETIYKVIIVPIFLYYSNVYISILDSQSKKVEKLQHPALKTINRQHDTTTFPTIKDMKDERCTIEVLTCPNGIGPKCFESYFKKLSHKKGT